METTQIREQWLVVGVGNPLRGDDGVGPYVAERMANINGLTTLSVRQLTPELAEVVAQFDKVIIVDAQMAGESVDSTPSVQKLEPAAEPQLDSHSFSVESLLHLSNSLFGRYPKTWLYVIPVSHMEFSSQISEHARQLAETAITWILTHFEASQGHGSKFLN